VGFETWWGLARYKKILSGIAGGQIQKSYLYIRLMVNLWIPAFFILLLSAAKRITPNNYGLCWFKPYNNSYLLYISLVIALIYFIYLSYSLVALRINAIKKVIINQNLPDTIKALLPVTRKEKLVWVFTSITAGIIEELIFRGFFFYLMGNLFPGLNIFIILGIAALIFGIGHIYQGLMEAVKPMFLGLVYGVFYIAFGSIIPCIILHAMQDLCATDVINDFHSTK
jgi:membrane protease YdiL (CAAX protease family)